MTPDTPPPGAPRLPTWRSNFRMAAAVERGLALQATAGTQVAGMYLRAHGVPLEVAYRVLILGLRRTASLHRPRHYLSPPPLIYRHTHPGSVELTSRDRV